MIFLKLECMHITFFTRPNIKTCIFIYEKIFFWVALALILRCIEFGIFTYDYYYKPEKENINKLIINGNDQGIFIILCSALLITCHFLLHDFKKEDLSSIYKKIIYIYIFSIVILILNISKVFIQFSFKDSLLDITNLINFGLLILYIKSIFMLRKKIATQ